MRHCRSVPARRGPCCGAARAGPARDDGRHRLPRPGRRRPRSRRGLLPGRPPALDHRRRGRSPALRERARARLGRPERRDLQPRRAPRRAPGARPRAAQPLRHRGPAAPVRGARARAGRAPPRDVRRRRLGHGRAPRRPDSRSPGDQAAVLRPCRSARGVRLGAEVRARQRAGQRRARPRGHRRVPHARLRAGAHDPAAPGPQAPARRAPGGGRRPGQAGALVALSGSRSRSRPPVRGRVGGDRARQARRVGAHAPDERRASGRDAQRRP